MRGQVYKKRKLYWVLNLFVVLLGFGFFWLINGILSRHVTGENTHAVIQFLSFFVTFGVTMILWMVSIMVSWNKLLTRKQECDDLRFVTIYDRIIKQIVAKDYDNAKELYNSYLNQKKYNNTRYQLAKQKLRFGYNLSKENLDLILLG